MVSQGQEFPLDNHIGAKPGMGKGSDDDHPAMLNSIQLFNPLPCNAIFMEWIREGIFTATALSIINGRDSAVILVGPLNALPRRDDQPTFWFESMNIMMALTCMPDDDNEWWIMQNTCQNYTRYVKGGRSLLVVIHCINQEILCYDTRRNRATITL